jgi:uncharacterized protein
MFVGFGTAVNIATIIGGAALGVLIGSRMLLRTRTLITEVLGLITILGAVSALAPMWGSRYVNALPKGWTLLAILGSLLLGGLIGSALNLESKLDSVGESLRKRFGAHEESTFVEGFVSASLLFAMAFAASLGWGVAAAAIPVGIYQGAWTLIGLGLGNILSGYQIDAMTITGGLMLVCIGLRLLKIKDIAVGNLLPALFIAPLFVAVLHSFQ